MASADGVQQSLDHDELFRAVMFARDRVYRLYQPTPIEPMTLPSGTQLWLKREDLSPINSYKWRGAFNKMSRVQEASPGRAVVAASAGNHAQGVSAAAAKLGCTATIYMPRSTPDVKIQSVQRIGGSSVRIELVGDTFDDAAREARACADQCDAVIIHPFDDPEVIAGQGTIGDEIVASAVRPGTVFLEIGGGGMAAGVACVLRAYYGDRVRIIGVEADGQASMSAAIARGEPITLERLDKFCDGTAVRRTGNLTFPLCRQLIDEFVLVSNTEVSAAIRQFWQIARIIPEPSGALGLAGALAFERQGRLEDNALTVVSGSNVDFAMLSLIARRAALGGPGRRFFEFEIPERPGTLVDLLSGLEPRLNIIEFQYGKVAEDVAYPVIGFEGSEAELEALERSLGALSPRPRPVSGLDRVEYRVIPLELHLFSMPLFLSVDFPERAGAMLEVMQQVRGMANICYFNYQNTGEIEGHSLLGFEFSSAGERERFKELLSGMPIRWREITPDALGIHRLGTG